jgi:glycolate oxidase FAD binding subunit
VSTAVAAPERVDAALARIAGAANVHALELGARSIPLVCPATAEEAQACVRHALERSLALLPVGLLSKLAWARMPARVDFALSTRRLRRVLAYEPGDGTIRVEAGLTLAELASTVAQGGHWLTPDVPRPGSATLGGAIGAGASGFDRLRFGPLRHHVLGLRVVDGHGELTKSGGQLVKNVTGYDLHRLYTGSHGTLCVIVEASLRLFALPERWVALAYGPLPHARALAAARTLLALPIRPYAVLVRDVDAAEAELCVSLGGRAEVVQHELACVVGALGAPALRRDDADALALARTWRDDAQAEARWPELVVECLPSRVADEVAALRRQHPDARLAIHPGLARIEVRRDGPVERAASAPPVGLALMRRLKSALDPRSIFAPGRMCEAS